VVYQRHTEINYVRYRKRRLFIAARRQAGRRRKTVSQRRLCGCLSRLHQSLGSSSGRQVSIVYVRAAGAASDGVHKVGDGDERLQATVDVVCAGFCRRARRHSAGIAVVRLQQRRLSLSDVNCPGVDVSSVDVELVDCFQSLGLTQLVAEPIRCVPGSTAHLLDVHATSRPALISDVKVDFLSDHRLVCATVATRAVKPVVVRASRNIRSIDTAKLDSALCQSELFSKPVTTVDLNVEQLDGVLTGLLAPVQLCRHREPKSTSKWLLDERHSHCPCVSITTVGNYHLQAHNTVMHTETGNIEVRVAEIA